MKTRLILLLALIVVPAAVQAQPGISTTAAARHELAIERKLQLESRREAAAALRAARTPEQRDAARARRAEVAGTLSASQLQFRADLQAYRGGLREKAGELRNQVRAGTMTQTEMALELKAYRDAKRPRNPDHAANRPSRTPESSRDTPAKPSESTDATQQ